ncbi:chemotaxis protein CheB [Plantactinospora sp. BB1]|uniref:chemotaxis protein CheB n=1 Tax=Plantactinospora sp. BB1 TaxID=2071627 RepID=UPI000D170EED|nr:chemotaxis protein CheB [Plantactinospora sp. BB1]AVT38426.1 chemotaxis protein CheB [Plantactinospora sp. BB1]
MSAGVPRRERRRPFDVVVVAASLGGPSALSQLLPELPADFPAPILLIQHRTPAIDGQFAATLRQRCQLPARLVEDGDRVDTPGIGVLPARHTGAVDPAGRIRLRHRDDFRLADPLIASVAVRYGARAISVVLTGRLDDGASGVRVLKCHGGRTIVQDPSTAAAPGMPLAALATGCVDLVMPLHRIGHALIALTMAPGAAELLRVPPSPWANLAA